MIVKVAWDGVSGRWVVEGVGDDWWKGMVSVDS